MNSERSKVIAMNFPGEDDDAETFARRAYSVIDQLLDLQRELHAGLDHLAPMLLEHSTPFAHLFGMQSVGIMQLRHRIALWLVKRGVSGEDLKADRAEALRLAISDPSVSSEVRDKVLSELAELQDMDGEQPDRIIPLIRPGKGIVH